MFEGSFVALVTPFKKGKVDYQSLNKLLEYHLRNGTTGIVACATTGEAPTLSLEEKVKIISTCTRRCRGKMSVIPYTGTNDTKETIEFTKTAASLKVDSALVVAPYYNKPTQEGLYQHFKAVANSVKIPIILYNVPSRTVVSITPETIARLAQIKNIVAVKQATPNLDEISQLRLLSNITILSGEDSLTYPMLALGAKGVISVVANIAPQDVVKMVRLYNAGLIDEAKLLHYKTFPLAKALFLETSPAPVKAAMKMLGMISSELRLPLVQISEENEAKLKAVISRYKF
jgi:4-hydroxy-tetrahydrodipicolinate synthase